MRNVTIVSPSGNLYGSEQVLLDFLNSTNNRYILYVPKGDFFECVKNHRQHIVRSFSSVYLLYIRLFFLLLIQSIDAVYINEAGHIKFILLLARIFSNREFYVHIRLLEDTKIDRLGKNVHNVKYISVSEYITNEVNKQTGIICKTMYDIYTPVSLSAFSLNMPLDIYRIGVVGRVTTTKGLNCILEFLEYIDNEHNSMNIEMHFYGGIDKHKNEVQLFLDRCQQFANIKCVFEGYVKDKISIYQNIDLLLHFNKFESLGRIVLESLDFGVPFIAFSAGGTGEIAKQLGVSDLMIDPDSKNWCHELVEHITNMYSDAGASISRYIEAREIMLKLCSKELYTKELESCFYE